MSKHSRDKSKEEIEIRRNLSRLGLLGSDLTKDNTVDNNPTLSAKVRHRGSLSRSESVKRPYTPTSTSSHPHKQSSISAGSLGTSTSLRRRRSFSTDDSSGRVANSTSDWRKRALHGGAEQHKMATVMATDRARSRRERTFVGGECAACEELLEHTLQGERVLQFSCGHVAHEACFYEYIKDSDSQFCPTCDAPLGLDSARGGSILDLGKLSSMVRSIAQNADTSTARTGGNTPLPWDKSNEEGTSVAETNGRVSQRDSHRDSRDSQRLRIEKLGITNTHSRNNSGHASSAEIASQDQQAPTRRHDYDLHAMETSVTEQRIRNSRTLIPSPIVTVRSEFPTLTRSTHQQSLTCLVTVEVPEDKRCHNYDDQAQSLASPSIPARPTAPVPGQLPQTPQRKRFVPQEPQDVLDEITSELQSRVDNWHGLDFSRFGALKLHNTIRVGKDRQSWQELECYLFGEMLICVKEKKNALPPITTSDGRRLSRCTLKGSILIKRHLKQVQAHLEASTLTLNLSVAELPTFHLQFTDPHVLSIWQLALLDLHEVDQPARQISEYEHDTSGTDDDDYGRQNNHLRRVSSVTSSNGGPRSATTAPTEYSTHKTTNGHSMPTSLHTPMDIVVVIPVSSSMQGLKINLLKDALRFLVRNLGERDRMGLVTFGSSQGGVPLVGMTTKKWAGWNKVLSSIRPVGQKSLRADVVDGANVAMDLLMQRKATNPISTIMLVSDSSTSDSESVNFVVSRAEAAKVGIYSFGLGLTHKPDSMIELSSRTRGSYLYVKDWMMLRDCVAGCIGSLQAISHQNARLRLKLPEGSPARFVKISGALHTTKRATGREAEAMIGDLRFGDKRDILVQLLIEPDHSAQEHAPQDHWESIVSGLEALGGSVESDDQRVQSIEELPLLQADLSFSDLQNDDVVSQLPRPSLLTITMLPPSRKSRQGGRPSTPPIPPHPHIVQRRMELLTSDMLTRALTLVSKAQHDRAHTLLLETRTILKGLAKGGFPPLPPVASAGSGISRRTSPPLSAQPQTSPRSSTPEITNDRGSDSDGGTPVPRAHGVDPSTMTALDSDIEASLEWINHPAVFSRDSRKAVLQAIGVISSQRGYTFRTASESLWAERIAGVKRMVEASREWREVADDSLTEEQ